MSVQRNAPCPCGSGKKYKNCCEGKKRMGVNNRKFAIGAAAMIIVAAGVWIGSTFITGKPDPTAPPPGQVWSDEHGHFHDTPGAAQTPLPTGTSAGSAPPPGPAPAGKIWNTEHGHYHDAPAGAPAADTTSGG